MRVEGVDRGMRDVPALTLEWRDGLFAHWPVDPDRIRPLVPEALALDTREGTAWVSILPSQVVAARPRYVPRAAGLTFPQVNLRTYVRYDCRPGVYFLSLDAATGLGVRLARAVYDLPYYRADVDFERSGDDARRVRFDCRRRPGDGPRAGFAAAYRPTDSPSRADAASRDEFLAERHRLFVVRDGAVWCTRIEHEPWPLCPAEATVEAESLLTAAGLPAPDGDPVVRYTPGVEATVRTPFRP